MYRKHRRIAALCAVCMGVSNASYFLIRVGGGGPPSPPPCPPPCCLVGAAAWVGGCPFRTGVLFRLGALFSRSRLCGRAAKSFPLSLGGGGPCGPAPPVRLVVSHRWRVSMRRLYSCASCGCATPLSVARLLLGPRRRPAPNALPLARDQGNPMDQ